MSDNRTKPNVKSHHEANSSLNDTNSSVKAQNSSLNDVNSSFNSSIINMSAKLEKIIKYLRAMIHKKTDVTGVITHFCSSNYSENQCFTTDDNKRYYRLTTKHSAAKPSRQPLAIFVSKTDLINTQKVTTDTDNNVVSSNRYTYGTGHSDVSYDGMSEPNKIPLWGNKFRRLNAVVVIPFIPFSKKYPSHTKHSGGSHA